MNNPNAVLLSLLGFPRLRVWVGYHEKMELLVYRFHNFKTSIRRKFRRSLA